MIVSENILPDIPVVCYHSIGPLAKNWNRNYLTLEPEFFEDQLKYFKKNFKTIFLREFWEMRNNLRPVNKNALVITIDDGFLDNWIWAFPLLKKYQVKATIFVCPEFIDREEVIRPNLENYWNNKVGINDLMKWGYLSWPELRKMIASGWIDIQSHTMSHTKYTVSDKLTGFHHPGNDCLYPVGNKYPLLKPYHISDSSFEKLIPYGYPLFEEMSSVCAHIVTINNEFKDACIKKLSGYNFADYSFNATFKKTGDLYKHFKDTNTLVTGVEKEEAYLERLNYEIAGSKKILEEKLNKPVEFLCWPHGDNSEQAHEVAVKAGYLATTTGSKIKIPDSSDRIPDRIGMHHVKSNRFLSLLKAKYKLGSFQGQFPYKQVNKSYLLIKNIF
jgi:Polysaccharide deacetylase